MCPKYWIKTITKTTLNINLCNRNPNKGNYITLRSKLHVIERFFHFVMRKS